MKKSLLFVLLIFSISTDVLAQEETKEKSNKTQTDKGKWFVQTDFGSVFSSENTASPTTMFIFNGSDDYSFGLSGGYFIKKDIAITAAFGYDKFFSGNTVSYNVGVKKYFKSKIFINTDIGAFHSSSSDLFRRNQKSNTFTARANVGYAWFIGKFLSIEPSLGMQGNFGKFRPDYDINLNLGLSIHF